MSVVIPLIEIMYEGNTLLPQPKMLGDAHTQKQAELQPTAGTGLQ